MENPEENSVNKVSKDKTLTARILSSAVSIFPCNSRIALAKFMIVIIDFIGHFCNDVWLTKRTST